MRQRLNPTRQDQRGAVLVEMAVVIPILLFMLVGVVDYALILREYSILQNAAREGARMSVLQQYWMDGAPTTAARNQMLADIRARVVNYLAQEQITIAATDVQVNQDVTIDLGGGVSASASRITVNYSRPVLLGNGWPFGPVALKGEVTFRNFY
jgi:Flp pilus assembly protein TadG